MRFDAKEIATKEFILNNVLYQLVSPDNVPGGAVYREFGNLAVIYRVLIGEDDEQRVSYVILGSLLRDVGISLDTLDTAAKRNTKKNGFHILPMWNFMFVVTGSNPWGASVILFPEFLRSIYERIGEDFYILPSSVCELICVPAAEVHPNELKRIVMEINGSVINENEYLSDSVYIYSGTEGKVSIAAE